jgi:hypothetical protein
VGDPSKTSHSICGGELELVMVTSIEVSSLVDTVHVATVGVLHAIPTPRGASVLRKWTRSLLLIKEVRHPKHLQGSEVSWCKAVQNEMVMVVVCTQHS